MKRNSRKGISWKMKKHMAEVLCVVVVMLSMTLSLYFQIIHNLDDKQHISLADQSAHAQIVNYGDSASLRMDSSTVRNVAGSPTSSDNNYGNSNDIKRNHVVSHMQGTNAPNQVVENPTTFFLASDIFENHGMEIEGAEAGILYQYPVELGYPVDNNYNGKQTEKGIIQDYDFDMPAEDGLYNDNRDEEDLTDGSEEPVAEETTEEKEADDSETGIQDGEESEQAAEDEKAVPKINNELQKKIWSKMLPTEPSQVKVTVKNVKKPADVTKRRLNVRKYKSSKKVKSSKNARLSKGAVKSRTKASVDGENTENNTEASVDKKSTEGDTETTAEEQNVEDDTEAPVSGEDVENNTETPAGGENVESSTETPAGGEDVGNDTEAPAEGDNAETTLEDNRVQADSSFFILSGKMRVDSQVFVSNIKIKPTGKNGFNKVRIGKEGDFQSSVTLKEDADEKEVTLYFSDGERETAGVTFAYSKDTSNPSMSLDRECYNVLQSGSTNIYCTKDAGLDLVLEDGSNGTGVDKVCYVYGDRVADFTNIADGSKASLSQDFYGRVVMNCADKAGNVSSVLSEYILLDRAAPTVTFSQDEVCTAPYTLWIDATDNGSIVSGLADVTCTVNGEPVEITNLEQKGVVTLDDNLEVPQGAGFSMTFEEEGEYTIQVRAVDYAGNITVEERNITVAKPEFVSVFMPETFTIHIDPQRLLKNEQIFSDDIELTNVSEFDVEVTVDSIELYVNNEASPEGIDKDCEIYFVTPDTGEKIKLEKGENKDVYSYCLPENAEGDIANLHFVGSTTEGSDQMWQSSDISIVVNLSFRKFR